MTTTRRGIIHITSELWLDTVCCRQRVWILEERREGLTVLIWEGSQVLGQFQVHCLKRQVDKYVQGKAAGMLRV